MCELDFITSSTFEQKFIITKLIRQSKYNLFISKCMDRILRISQLTQPIKNLNPKMYTFIVLVVYFLYLSKTKTLINFAFSYQLSRNFGAEFQSEYAKLKGLKGTTNGGLSFRRVLLISFKTQESKGLFGKPT